MMEIPSYRYNVLKERRSKKMVRRVVSGGLALLILGSSGSYTSLALNKALPPVNVSVNQLQVMPAAASLTWPAAKQSAIGTSTDGVLTASVAAETAIPIASVAKIITALAVMRVKPFAVGQTGATLKLDSEDISYYNLYVAKGGSVTAVNIGQELSQYDALQALLLPSSNNMADSLVRWAFGSQDAYTAYANAMLKDYGLTRSYVADASGFSPQTVSTASELVILGQKLLANEVLAGIVSKSNAVIPVAGTIKNVNQLLGDPTVIGIKTGNTDEAGGCLLFAARHSIDTNHQVIIIGAVIGSSSIRTVFNESSALLSAAKAGFGIREVIKAGTVVGSISAPWGKSTDIITKEPLIVYGWKGNDIKPAATIKPENIPLKKGQRVGNIEAVSYNQTLSIAVEANDDLPLASASWKLTNYF